MRISLPPVRQLCTLEILNLRLASPRATDALKLETANQLAGLDRFEEALREYQSIADNGPNWAIQLQTAKMHRAIGGRGDSDRARKILESALHQHDEGNGKALLLTELGDIYRQAGDLRKAAGHFREALEIDPEYSKALRKFAVTLFDQGKIEELLRFCEQQIAGETRNTRLHASYFTALAKLGRIDEAAAIRGLDRFMWQGAIDRPANFASVEALNEALAQEIRKHPALRFENSQQASEHSWRVDELMTRNPPAILLLLDQIAARVKEYAKRVGGEVPHLFTDFMPARARIQPWSIVTHEKGFENWHTHDKGWLSGVYYVAVPDGLADGLDRAGAIEFGWPERLLGEGSSEKFGNKLVHPQPGMLLLFPSHTHHRTFPHGQTGERIVVSFDIVPES